MQTTYQERIFLSLLDDTEEVRNAKKILKSPLGLAHELISLLFKRDFNSLKGDLDIIKKFVAGISRAEKLESNYKLASYYPYLFSFHQFVHSSYRARQGKVLEEMLKTILENYGNWDVIPSTVKKMKEELKILFSSEKIPYLDIDVMGMNSINKNTVLMQLRSRDDTGGTTAKGSLVDMLRELLRIDNIPMGKILYLVCIWDPRQSQQRDSTVKKMYLSLKDSIDITEKDFYEKVLSITGLEIKTNITLKMSYGTTEMAESLYIWDEKQDSKILTSIPATINLIENWDDLWISYAIASLELEVNSSKEKSNIELLNEKFENLKIPFNFNSYIELTKSIDSIIEKIIPLWQEDSMPFASPSDQIHYLRDLLFLKAYYDKHN
ncbi:MAG: hypothetical protein OEV44_12925 [Spirochaetota bacterium]|nr:hypothetical protein [Spirochaetota bacterium]